MSNSDDRRDPPLCRWTGLANTSFPVAGTRRCVGGLNAKPAGFGAFGGLNPKQCWPEP